MVGVHPLAELAPRDVVSREIERVMNRCGRRNVWLDARHLGESYLRGRFPNIWRACADAGFDLAHDLVPVAPAAHYLVGGVRVDMDGRTSVPGLFASGEVAATGLHGANRLASNSLLEGLVFSRRIARALDATGWPPESAPAGSGIGPARAEAHPAVPPSVTSGDAAGEGDPLARLHRVTGAHLGMTRTEHGLEAALHGLRGLEAVIESAVPEPRAAVAGLEFANLVTVASLIARAAALREESRGCHSRLDHPERDDERWRGHTVFRRGDQPRFEPLTP